MKKLFSKIKSMGAITVSVLVLITVVGIGSLVTAAKPIGALFSGGYKDSLTSQSTPSDVAHIFIDGIDNGINNNTFLSFVFTDIFGITQKALDRDVIEGMGGIYTDSNGWLMSMMERLDVSDLAQGITDVSEYADEKGIDMMYVQAPSKNIRGYTELPDDFIDFSNENADDMLSRLRKGGVNCLDIRDSFGDLPFDLSQTFYSTDSHWTNYLSFHAYTKAVEKLNSDYGYGIDEKYIDADNYDFTVYEDSFLGEIGVSLSPYYAGLDDFVLVTPKFDTSMTMQEYYNGGLLESRSGTFSDALVFDFYENEFLKSYSTSSYHSYLKSIYNEKIITNDLVENDKKLLVVSDSFGLPFAAYLSTCFSETRSIDMRYGKITDGIYNYIDEYQPDTVIILLSAKTYHQVNTEAAFQK